MKDIHFLGANTKYISSSADKDQYFLLVRSTSKMLIFSPHRIKFIWSSPKKGTFFCGSFMFLFCLMFAMSLCASVYMCFVVTCWERADLLALVCGV